VVAACPSETLAYYHKTTWLNKPAADLNPISEILITEIRMNRVDITSSKIIY
jgi:hypothetical protein